MTTENISTRKETPEYVAVLECADGNEVAGTAWIETRICTGETTVAELMAWKEKQRGAHGKFSITKAT